MVEGYRLSDPPYVPQLVLPTTVPQNCFKAALLSNDDIVCTVECLSIIAFFYLLCVGEYTKPRYFISGGKRVRSTQTQQFSVGDVEFNKGGHIVPWSYPVNVLLTSDSATQNISHQKNNWMGEKIIKRRQSHTWSQLKPFLVWYTTYYNKAEPHTYSSAHKNATTYGNMSNQ